MSRWPISLEFEVDDREFQKYMRQAIRRGKDLKPPLKRSGVVMTRSFAENFKAQGRPNRWDPLAPNTIAQRRKRSENIYDIKNSQRQYI